MDEATYREIHGGLVAVGQSHLLQFWDELSSDERRALVEQIRGVDFDQLAGLGREDPAEMDLQVLASSLQTPPSFEMDVGDAETDAGQALQAGQEAIAAGRGAVAIVAGGQGTRLGFPDPKGMYPIGPVSGATLFQILIEKVVAMARRWKISLPVYLMTSPATHDVTKEFLDRHERFGLPADDLKIFCQGVMPAVDAVTGQVLMRERGGLFLSPDGHGGMIQAARRQGVLDDMQRRGIDLVFYMQVDNVLAPVADPQFLGYHLVSGSQATTMVVRKTDPLMRVGNVVRLGGKLRIIEYSDLPEQLAVQRNRDGTLLVWAGNLGIHVFSRSLLDEVAEGRIEMPFHLARKKVPFLNQQGDAVEPTTPNAIKFERFIFDLLPAAEHSVVVEVEPQSYFAPLKNAPGSATDSPETVKAQLMHVHRDWLRQAGAELDPAVAVEVSPLFASDARELGARIPAGTRISRDTYLADGL